MKGRWVLFKNGDRKLYLMRSDSDMAVNVVRVALAMNRGVDVLEVSLEYINYKKRRIVSLDVMRDVISEINKKEIMN